MCAPGTAVCVAAAYGIKVNVAYSNSNDEAPLRDSQSPVASLTATISSNPLLIGEDCDVSVAEIILRERLETVICDRDNFSHTLNEIKERFQKTDHKLRGDKM